jgi:hypothetical protein
MQVDETAKFFFAAVCGLLVCGCGAREAVSVEPLAQHTITVAAAPKPHAVDAAAPTAAAAPPDAATPLESVKLEDVLPLCAFADWSERAKAPALRDVRKQTLLANTRLVFGTYASVCLNEACDALPTHQCWVDHAESNTLVVHSRLSYQHKRGTVCAKDCQPLAAGCETEVLEAGQYTIKYGARTFTLRVPSVMRTPCFKLE